MKRIALILTMLFSVHALAQGGENVHPAVAFVQDFVNKTTSILESERAGAARTNSLCHLVKERFGLITIGTELLGSYRQIKRDRVGVKTFNMLLPSFLISRVLPQLDRLSGAVFDAANVSDRGNNTVQVDASLGGYNVSIMLYHKGSSWKIIDGQAFGFSAIESAKKSVQEFLSSEYSQNPSGSHPVSALVNSLLAEPGFVRCH